MAELPVLYSFRRCPYAMRARMALVASDTRVVLREVDLGRKPEELLAASAKATVPVLVLPDGAVIAESLDIMRWALARNDPAGWLDGEDAALVALNDGPFKQHLDRTKYPDRYPGSDAADHRRLGLAMLGALEARLAQSRFLSGERLSLTDVALVPFVRQFAAIDAAWFAAQALPRLQAWLAAFVASPLFIAAMSRFPVWRPGDAVTLFPNTAP